MLVEFYERDIYRNAAGYPVALRNKLATEIMQLLCTAFGVLVACEEHQVSPGSLFLDEVRETFLASKQHRVFTEVVGYEPYKLTNVNVDLSLWTRYRKSNFAYLVELGSELCRLFQWNRNKPHRTMAAYQFFEQYLIFDLVPFREDLESPDEFRLRIKSVRSNTSVKRWCSSLSEEERPFTALYGPVTPFPLVINKEFLEKNQDLDGYDAYRRNYLRKLKKMKKNGKIAPNFATWELPLEHPPAWVPLCLLD